MPADAAQINWKNMKQKKNGKEMSWIVDKGSEGILSQHAVNWPSLGLFGLKLLASLMDVNANEHLICSALCLEESYSFCQNGNLT